jgi:meckelin
VSFLLICIGAVIFILDSFETYINGSKLNSFVDLCTLANVSLIMMAEYSYGYYLHAKAPWGQSDIPLDWLQKEIQGEQ